MESRPRSVLAAFQEHLQLASTKCGSLMEQLNIVRKKVEGNDAMTMNVLDPGSGDFLENVSQKTVLHLEEMDLMGHKDVHNKEEMAVDNAYADRSTGDMNYDANKPLMKRTKSQHSDFTVNKEEEPFFNGNVTPNEDERYSLIKFDGATNHKRPEEIIETTKVSGKGTLNALSGEDEDSFTQDLSSDDDSTLSSCSTSDNDVQKPLPSDGQNIYEELLKRLKDNEEKKNINNRRSSSENSSSTYKKSQGSNKSPKKISSKSTVNEDNSDKKNGDVENLDVGVDFFLPSSVTEKFQEMLYEESTEDDTMTQNNANKDKNMRVTFDDLIVGRPRKDSRETPSEYIINGTSIQTKFDPNQTDKKLSNLGQTGKVKENNCDSSSLKTKSDKNKKPSTTICSSTVMNMKLHSPEMSLYKRLNGLPLRHETKKIVGRKEIKSKKNTKQKAKYLPKEPKLKTLPDKKDVVAINNDQNTKNENKSARTENKTEKDMVVPNKTPQKTNIVAANKPLNKKSTIEIITTNSKPKKVDKAKLPIVANGKRDSLDETFNQKEEIKQDIVNLDSKTANLKKNQVPKSDEVVNLNEKFDSNSKNMATNKNHVITSDVRNISKEKLVQPVKKTIVKETKPVNTRIDQQKKNNMRMLTAGKELSPKNNNNTINGLIIPTNVKSKNNIERSRPATSAKLVQPKKESIKLKLPSARKEESFDTKNLHPLETSFKTKEPSVSLKVRHHMTKETIHSPSMNDLKTNTASFPFILGQSTSKTYNVRAAIQQTMSMIMRSPAETLRRSSFSEMLNASSKASTVRTSNSCTSGRKVCPACVERVDEEDNEPDENPLDPWDTEYHSKRFIRCTCMPRNTVNFKTVMNQLLHETSSSYILPTESYLDSEVENGQENRVSKSLFRKNNNIYKLSKLLHTLLKIRDLLVT